MTRPAFRDTLVRGFALGFFVTIPAAIGYLALAVPLARAISFGRMGSAAGVTHGRRLAGGAVARGRRPDRVHDRHLRVLRAEGHAVAAAVDDAAGRRVPRPGEPRAVRARPGRAPRRWAWRCRCRCRRRLPSDGPAVAGPVAAAGPSGSCRRWPGSPLGAAIMAGPAWLTATPSRTGSGRPFGPRTGIARRRARRSSGLPGPSQALWRTPELGWLAGGLGQLRGKAGRAVAGAGHGVARSLPGTYRSQDRRQRALGPATRS